MRERHPVYAEADLVVDSGELPSDDLAAAVWARLAPSLTAEPRP
jgi:hypothetical protein